MQAVEHFVLQEVKEQSTHSTRGLDANDRLSQMYVGRVMPSIPQAVVRRSEDGSSPRPAD